MDTPHNIVIRTITLADYDRIVEIDMKITGLRRLTYYRRKMHASLSEKQRIITSLVAEVDGRVAGFVMGDVLIGDFGVPEAVASIDTLGVDPEYQRRGVARALITAFISAVKNAGAEKIMTLVQWKDLSLLHFFSEQGFSMARTLPLELTLVESPKEAEGSRQKAAGRFHSNP